MEVKRRTIRSLVAKLSSVSEHTRSEALCELRLITKHDAESRPIIADAGAIPYLAETLYSVSHAAQDDAAATLLNLSISSRNSLISTRAYSREQERKRREEERERELDQETMAATVSPWAKPGAWALDSEEHEDELLHQQNDKEATPLADFPSLSAAATTKPKKKKGQTFSLADFTTYAAPKPPSHATEPIGLTHQDRLVLPTGPRERTAEELERNGLGNGFRSYGLSGYDRGNRNGDDSSNSKWGSRGSDRSGRESNRESAPSRADEIDNWAAAKKPVMGNGFDRKERRGFFDSQSKADESDSWVSNKSYVPSEGRRFSGNGFEREKSFDRERRGFPSNGGGADSDNWGKKREDLDNWPKKREDSDSWGKKKEESIGGIGNEGARPRLNLQPRTLPASNGSSPGSGTAAKPKGSNPFGEARPREEVLAEKGQDWKKIDEQLESLKIKEANEKADGFGKRSFGNGNGHPSERAERSWRKPEAADTGSQSEEKVENEQVEAEAEES